ncbi:MAG: delta-60 repeat domain-containing protein [Nocardioidaceae bacterium]|nr:delta-60 repeat domain-containing protein [Nocardioidaceae bacterium]
MLGIRPLAIAAALGVLAGLTAAGGSASASLEHPTVVSEDPVDFTPHLVDDGGSGPLALAVAKLGGTMFIGGRFSAVENSDRTTTTARQNIVAFDAGTGAISNGFAPSIDGPVYSLLSEGSSVYVGGSFDTVNGMSRPAIAKLDATTGALDTGFQPSAIPGGRVSEIRLVDGRLLVGGTFGRNLVALNPDTGRNTGYIDIAIDGKVPLSTSKTEVYRFAVNPAGTRLVGVGNFTSVGGQDRSRAFMLNLDAGAATLSPWYYPPLRDKCESNTATRQAYLDDVDFSPDGSYFVFVSTGFVTDEQSQIGTHVCDAAARFETDVLAPTEPTWINYTGGDTLHSVAVTGAAVYVQGHNRWLDNPQGRDSCDPATGCVERKGLGAIDPDTGLALPWNPVKPAAQGGQDFLATDDGLWVVSDSRRFNGEYHRGIAFAPLP